MRLLILSWLWSQPDGRATYTAHHVNIWADMIRRNLSIDHDIACVTDMPAGIDPRVRIIAPPGDFLDVTIPTWRNGRPQCFRRLSMFRPDAKDLFGGERIVSLDLDVVVTGALDPLFAGGEDFRICRGTAAGRAVNGSMYMIRAGSRPSVYTDFTPERAVQAGKRHVGSDQSWIAHCLGDEPTWGPEDGVVSVQQRHLSDLPRLITYPGTLKPWTVAAVGHDRIVSENYRRSPSGAALVLGYGEALWTDAAAALDGGRHFDAVIASPEAAAHWPGEILAVADDDAHAERLAAMHGLEPVWCGRGGQ
jgi:hypothetical protein